MKRNWIIKFGVVALIFIIFGVVAYFVNRDNYEFEDSVKYEGKVYGLLEYNADIFTYNYNGNDYLEEDLVHPIKHDKWKVVYLNGDLFILDKQVKEATDYYTNDDNYEWFIVFDDGNNEVKKSISISKEEFDYLYNMDDMEKNETIVFEDIEIFGDILKVSKDQFIQGVTTLAKVHNNWYYKTEVMNDNDEEYVIKLPDSLNKKINDLKIS